MSDPPEPRQAATGHARAPAPRDEAAVRRFIEDFAQALTEMGVPRMPAVPEERAH